MAEIEVDISDHLDMQIEQLVDEGEFLNRQEAIAELLEAGLSTYQTTPGEEEGEVAFADEMMNPGERPASADEDDSI